MILEECLKEACFTGITFWGFTDQYSWVPHFSISEGSALLFDSELVPKPALDGVCEALCTATGNEETKTATSAELPRSLETVVGPNLLKKFPGWALQRCASTSVHIYIYIYEWFIHSPGITRQKLCCDTIRSAQNAAEDVLSSKDASIPGKACTMHLRWSHPVRAHYP
jgi:endo-1,4-beta-xylanase